ncbi:tripartite tricarboxylate transporter substrate binding protein [Variovorax paradoxus]|uniref:Bug family tripartite tricarboxylate transporter substrate binding protein n=1 Tax=Variovorax paradoxus TaxID=34073 RepID=UPI0021ACC70A|nr:tripartite tricarboxylate transporter substrate binding protein [Variovorax paradoxus]UVH55128.1 tripartite tricarboxylate transporter substrate binding protein [Variovorax paradoxus]
MLNSFGIVAMPDWNGGATLESNFPAQQCHFSFIEQSQIRFAFRAEVEPRGQDGLALDPLVDRLFNRGVLPIWTRAMTLLRFKTLLRQSLAVCGLLGAAVVQSQAQPAYPTKTVTIVVPYPAGGTTDVLARLIADVLRKQGGQPVVVENQSGAGGSIAGRRVITAAPDGHTLLMTSSGINAVTPTVYKEFKPLEGLTQVSVLVDVPFVMVVGKKFPVQNLPDFIAYAKQRPGSVTIGNVSLGSHGHLAQLLFDKAAGVNLIPVPYRGSTPAINDLLGGQIDGMIDNVSVQKPFIESGKVQALFVTSRQRSDVLADVPTAKELGLPFESMAWFGLAAPRNTSPEIVKALRDMVAAGFKDKEQRQKLIQAGLTPVFGTSAEANERVKVESRTLGDLAAALNLPRN